MFCDCLASLQIYLAVVQFQTELLTAFPFTCRGLLRHVTFSSLREDVSTQLYAPSVPERQLMFESSNNLKERVRAFWQKNPCGTKFTDAEMGTRLFYERTEEHRYEKEWHIPEAADFQSARGLRVLEIGCGLGTDGAQFAKAGAIYTGVDLTDAAVELARKRFELFDLPGEFRKADAENLDFAD
jgi:SAM-dependent methyltransferase